MKVDDKSNEITAIPALLELIDIAGSVNQFWILDFRFWIKYC
jgi:hypothetical protein